MKKAHEMKVDLHLFSLALGHVNDPKVNKLNESRHVLKLTRTSTVIFSYSKTHVDMTI